MRTASRLCLGKTWHVMGKQSQQKVKAVVVAVAVALLYSADQLKGKNGWHEKGKPPFQDLPPSISTTGEASCPDTQRFISGSLLFGGR